MNKLKVPTVFPGYGSLSLRLALNVVLSTCWHTDNGMQVVSISRVFLRATAESWYYP